MEAVLTQINRLASTADGFGRKKLQLALRDAQFALEMPYDTTMRIAGLVRPLPQCLLLHKSRGQFSPPSKVEANLANWIVPSTFKNPLIRVAVNLNIFTTLASSSAPLSVDELATKSGASPELLGTAQIRSLWRTVSDNLLVSRTYPPLPLIQRLYPTNVSRQVHREQYHQESY
jgi:hypothetical protein